MTENNIRRLRKLDRRTQESLLTTNRLLREEVVSLMLDIAILREESARHSGLRTLSRQPYGTNGSADVGTGRNGSGRSRR